MDPTSQRTSNGTLNCTTRVIKVQKFTSSSSVRTESGSTYLSNGDGENTSPAKSFIQQRIERLYGPGALGIAFCAKRAQLERHSPSPHRKTSEESVLEAGQGSPPGLPSVFKHLRPEFRHQLPVKPKRTLNGSRDSTSPSIDHGQSPLSNGHRVRHIPIQLEDDFSPSKPPAEDIPDRKTVTNDITISVKPKFAVSPLKDQPVEVKLDIKKSLDLNRNVQSNNESSSFPPQAEIKDGHYFLKIVAEEVSLLEPKIALIDQDLKEFGDSMSEEVRGKVFTANCKTKLLIAQKVDQFKGLCHKNINKSNKEEFPTTDEDLAGFWDMVTIQVVHIKDLLAEVDQLRDNKWVEVKKISVSPLVKKKKDPVRKGVPKKNPEKDAAKAKANEERRRAMREAMSAKRKAAAGAASSDQIEIFVPNK